MIPSIPQVEEQLELPLQVVGSSVTQLPKSPIVILLAPEKDLQKIPPTISCHLEKEEGEKGKMFWLIVHIVFIFPALHYGTI